MTTDRVGSTSITVCSGRISSGSYATMHCFEPGCRNHLHLDKDQVGGDRPIRCGDCGSVWSIDDPTRVNIFSVDIRTTSGFWIPDWWDDPDHLEALDQSLTSSQMIQQFVQRQNRDAEDDVPDEPDELSKEVIDGCRCCSAEVDLTRKGFCFGCDLAGCTSDSDEPCQHRAVTVGTGGDR